MVNESNVEQMSSAEERAKRVRHIRDALRLSRQKFADKYQIPPGSLQNWEDARFGGLSEKGAKRLINALQTEGLDCRLEWLLYGIGNDPVAAPPATPGSIIRSKTYFESDVIAQELSTFHQLNPNAVDLLVTDDAMLPAFLPGDYIAGRRYFGPEIHQAIGHPCIVHLDSNTVLFRQVEAGNAPDLYTLRCTNAQTSAENPIVTDTQLFSAAPILWIRRKSPR